jgi:hypothetical protein
MQAVALGTIGWDQPAWSSNFYPADMPADWHLTFYNTQFACVFLAESFWRQAGASDHAVWAADTHEEFTFLLEGARPDELPTELAGRVRGVERSDPALIWFDRETPLKPLAARITQSDAQQYLLSADGDLGQIERVRTLLELLGL